MEPLRHNERSDCCVYHTARFVTIVPRLLIYQSRLLEPATRVGYVRVYLVHTSIDLGSNYALYSVLQSRRQYVRLHATDTMRVCRHWHYWQLQ